MKRLVVALILLLLLTNPGPAAPILIGVEYAPPGLGKTFAKMGVTAAKHYPDSITWGDMQRTARATIDFSKMDRFVKEYQTAGFRDLVIVLKAKCSWGSKNPAKNFAPKTEYLAQFEAWVRAVADRYNKDGKNDMPGLRFPVRYYELGSEFSTFEPTPTADYLDTLARVYKTVHAVHPKAVVMHAAFLTTTALKSKPNPARYETAFAAADKRILHKSLADIRKVLDKPKLFDAVNFHALGDPLEIEDIVAWLRWEMKQRKYTRPLIISDTAPSPLIAWGPATIEKGPFKGLVIPPATEVDRPRLNKYFKKLIDEHEKTVAFNHAFVAADMVKKVVVAAEQGVELINTAFMEDLPLFKKPFQAGAGTSAWAGMAETKINFLTQERTVVQLRPAFHALARLALLVKNYDKVERVKLADKRVRLYRFERNRVPLWVGWLETATVILPEDKVPSATVSIKIPVARVAIEPMIDRAGVTRPEQTRLTAREGSVRVTLTPRPVFVIPAR